MSSKLSISRLANLGAIAIYEGFGNFCHQFHAITHRAHMRFDSQDWHGMQADARQRLGLYRQVIDGVVKDIKNLLGSLEQEKLVWASMKAVYSGLIMSQDNWEIAETFFNSVTRRIFATVGVDPQIEFVDTDFETPPSAAKTAVYHSYPHATTTAQLFQTLLMDYRWQTPYAQLETDAALITKAVTTKLGEIGALRTIDRLEVVKPVFYRGMGAYIIGRIFSGSHVVPLALAIIHGKNGLIVDAVLLDEESISILFSFAHSYFHVQVERPYDLVQFLKTIVPRKRTAELYISIGYNKHGKTELYRDILRHLAVTTDQFEEARGQRGMVMTVFNMPNYDLVFKLIKDHFAYPKDNTRKGVMAKYDLVFRHDRAGRLIDAQSFEHLQFDREHFSDALLSHLLDVAGETVCVRDEKVVIEHTYVTRRVIPLDIYVKEAAPEAAKTAVIDYGQAIKDMACSNIFPGDMLLKNFGVTRHGRVVFYDYDELCLLGDCNFRRIPPGAYEDELSDQPWFHVAENDIFPEEFIHFLGLPEWLKEVFLAHHGDLCQVDFWLQAQRDAENGRLSHIYPYRPEQRLPHE